MTAELLSDVFLTHGHCSQMTHHNLLFLESKTQMAVHSWSKLLKSHLHPHPIFLAFYWLSLLLPWALPNLVVYLTFSILFGPWFSFPVSSQLTLLSGASIVSGESLRLLLNPSEILTPSPGQPFCCSVYKLLSLHFSYGWDWSLYLKEPGGREQDPFRLGHIFSQFSSPSAQPSP